MARDYAQRSRGGRQTKGSSGGLPGWVWLFAGLSAGLAVAAFVYISRPSGGSLRDGVAIAAPPPPVVPASERKRHEPPVPIPPREKPRFSFYELLPNQEVVVPREVVNAKPAAPASSTAKPADDAPASNETYVIQVASFRERDDADREKANLALLGVESRVESVTIDGKDTYYRVRVGPEKKLERAQMLLKRLEDNGVQALLVKVK